MELKYGVLTYIAQAFIGLNRTFMELKSKHLITL